MTYLVSITRRAERDLANLYGEIHAQHSGAALEWYRGLKQAILSLE
jgi:plasmid stabilization system protein ParE